jgi:hypothetical protein
MPETRCPACKTVNRVPRYSISEVARCGKCLGELPPPALIKVGQKLYRHRRAPVRDAAAKGRGDSRVFQKADPGSGFDILVDGKTRTYRDVR